MWQNIRNSLLLALLLPVVVLAQGEVMLGRGPFSAADRLRGSLSPHRSCYDVLHYALSLRIRWGDSTIAGGNTIRLRYLHTADSLQIDLMDRYAVDSVLYGNTMLPHHRRHQAIMVAIPPQWQPGEVYDLRICYQGQPRSAPNPPWDGGYVWAKDSLQRPWLGVACEGYGASSWWPCKDHLSDEPDSGMTIAVKVPQPLTVVCNGVLTQVVSHPNKTHTWHWRISYPINSYNVTLNVGHYAHIAHEYTGQAGPLKLDYYVLDYNRPKAERHFQQVEDMLDCFENKLGPYPYYRDGYALVETPYWGMEHQGAIAYGNHYENNPWGWDYIIVHESGHEWFGNRISVADHADMWVHEAFTTYTEALLVECQEGYRRACTYLQSQRGMIFNQDAIQGPRGVNYEGWKSSDMYYKGSWMLHTLRSTVNNDSLWWAWLRSLPDSLGPAPTSTEAVLAYTARHLGPQVLPIFHQYLYYKDIPRLQWQRTGNQLMLRWQAHPQFVMPVELLSGNAVIRIDSVSTQFRSYTLPADAPATLRPDQSRYYIEVEDWKFEPLGDVPKGPDKRKKTDGKRRKPRR